MKAFGLLAAFDDFQGKAALAAEFAHLPRSRFQLALAAVLSKNQGHVQKQMAEQAKEGLRAILALHAGRTHMDAEEQTLGIGQEVAFAAFDFLSRREAAGAGPDGIGAFDALAVNDGRAGVGVFLASGAAPGARLP